MDLSCIIKRFRIFHRRGVIAFMHILRARLLTLCFLLVTCAGIIVFMLHSLLPLSSASSPQIALGVATPGGLKGFLDYSRLINRKPAIALMGYQPMTYPFNAAELNGYTNLDVVPMLSINNPPGLYDRQIAQGSVDAALHQYAKAAAAWGKPLFWRIDWEMNGNWYLQQSIGPYNTSQDYIDMWQHIVTIFRQEGANNVKFVYSPNVLCDHACIDFGQMYPGNSYVDWIALDGYNWGTFRPDSSWESFIAIFGKSYARMLQVAPGKPMMIAEMGSAEQGGDKAAWITTAFITKIPASFPMLKAIIWFNFKKESEPDWRVNSSETALQAYKKVVADPYYQAQLISNNSAWLPLAKTNALMASSVDAAIYGRICMGVFTVAKIAAD
jgi:hypothetical protein